ncbi:MAG: Smr/MutS family protein [Muribaculaceae bacterium]|nr:Smr/MutS family protein [Muribaculaceae bacterium]
MIYPTEFESKLGFDTVRSLVADKCVSRMGREEVAAMAFSSDFDEIGARLRQTAEMASLLRSRVDIPGTTLYDVGPYLAEIRAEGSYMTADRLHKLAKMLDTMRSVHDFFTRTDSESGRPSWPALASVFSALQTFPVISAEIDRCVSRHGEVKDTASEALYDIRRQIASMGGSMQRVLRRVLDRAASEGIIERDAAPSLRDGRMVIPVPAAMKRRLNGIVHDESATGKTVFIEPAEVVEAGNRLRELEMEEHREIVRILMGVAAVIRPHTDAVAGAVRLLGVLDFIRAKGEFAVETDAQMPVLERKPEIDWYHALHPVLMLTLRKQGRETVPLNLRLDSATRFLIISGPNAGGKSVCLKTVGIVQYMTQCGLLPTLYSNSHIGVFDNILVDIGDEQSIENDLSTYSSHLRNMKYFMAHSGPATLVLADEMGSGTEPQIGGALAQAILMRLARSGCMGIVTTHYQNLKTFAEDTDGFVNGAMLYDRQHLRPTFQLSVGSPGSSFALEIARNIGLPAEVVENAKEIVGTDYVNADKYLLDIQRDRRYWANKRQNIKEKENRIDDILSKYEGTAESLRTQRAAIIADARREAREIMKTANARLEGTIREIRESQAEKERTRAVRRELDEYRASLEKDEASDNIPDALKPLKHKSRRQKEKTPEKKVSVKKEIAPGDYVRMSDGGVVGQVLSVSGKKAEVAFGALRTFVELSRLKEAKKPVESALTAGHSVSASTWAASREHQLNFKQEIDVRGMRADEALQAVTYFIDDAIQFNASKVRILHGTGHGILKTLIRQMLKANGAVASAVDEDVRFGGAGITVVEFK